MRTVYATECTTAWTVATRATQRWKLLYVAKSQPVNQSRALFLTPNAQIKTKFVVDITPVRSATYLQACVDG